MTATGVVINGKIGNSVAWSKKVAPFVQFITIGWELIAAILWLCYMLVGDLILVLRRDYKFFFWVGAFYFPYLLFYKFAGPYFVRH